jgi:hypothetical protein
LCPDCRHNQECVYQEQYRKAIDAQHAIATQARGMVSMEVLSRDRSLIMLHENPMAMLRPTFVTLKPLKLVEIVAEQAETYAEKPYERYFYRYLASVAGMLHGWHHGVNETTEVPLPKPAKFVPFNAERLLNDAIIELGVAPPAQAMQLVLAAVRGELSLIAVAVDEKPSKSKASTDEGDREGNQEEGEGEGESEPQDKDKGSGKKGTRIHMKLERRLVGVCQTDLPHDRVVWINDATLSQSELEMVLGCPVANKTPRGMLLRHHPVLQIVPIGNDVTKGRKIKGVADQLRGIIHDLPYQKVGVLTHIEFAGDIKELLGEPYAGRVAMVDYFGSGLSRGSNQWHRKCDALIVLGTPRVGADAVREHLIRLGKMKAACLKREGMGWEWDEWYGSSESGQKVTVRTQHYSNRDWHLAYCSLVRSELVQAVGRGRGVLPEGIPVYVVTTENLAPPNYDAEATSEPDDAKGPSDIPIAENPFAPLDEKEVKILAALRNERGGRVVRKTSEIARLIGCNRRWMTEQLRLLEIEGRIRRIGNKGGWYEVAK